MKTNQKKLKLTLLANALFSTISGSVIILFTSELTHIFQLKSSLPMLLIGWGLMLFMMQLLWLSFKKTIPLFGVNGIIIQDVLWILGSIILLLWNPFSFPYTALWITAIIASIVTVFAFMQWKYSKN
jgi:hypothetical protein